MNLADYEIQNEITNSDSSDIFWVAKHVLTKKLCLLKLELTKEHYAQTEMENISLNLKNLNHPSLPKLFDTKYDGEFLYGFWDLPQGGTLLQRLFAHNGNEDIHNKSTWRNKLNEGADLDQRLRKKSTSGPEFDSICYNPQLDTIKQKFTETHLKEIMYEIAEAVKHLHLSRLFHGNLDISSIFYDENGNIKLGYISLNTNMQFTRYIQESANIPATTSEKPITREKANLEYLKKDINDLQGLFLSLAKRNINQLTEIDIMYSPHFRTFLFELERKSYADITTIIERIQEIGLKVREENNEKVQSLFYPEGLEETKAEILDTSLQSISITSVPHLPKYAKYGENRSRVIPLPINTKTNILNPPKSESKTLTKDSAVVKQASTRKRKFCICILILIIILLLGLNIWMITLNAELREDLSSTDKKRINAELDNEELSKNITQLSSYISAQDIEIANLNKGIIKLNDSYNSLIIEKKQIIEDKEVLLKDIQNEKYINNILRDNIYQLNLKPASILTVNTTKKYSPTLINDNFLESAISTQKKDDILANLLMNNINQKDTLNKLKFKYRMKIRYLENEIQDMKFDKIRLKEFIKETQNILRAFLYIYRNVKEVENSQQLYNIKTNNYIFQTLIEYLKHIYNEHINYLLITTSKKTEIVQKENEISDLKLQLHNSIYRNYWMKQRYQLDKLDNQYLIQRNYQQKEYYSKQIYSGKNSKINLYDENKQKIYIYEHILTYYFHSVKTLKDYINNQVGKRQSLQTNTSITQYSWLKNNYELLEKDNEILKQRNKYQANYYSEQIYRLKNSHANFYHTNELKLFVYEFIFLDYAMSLKLLKDYINNHRESYLLQINSSENQNYYWLKSKCQLLHSDKHYLTRKYINQMEHCSAQIYLSKNNNFHLYDKKRHKLQTQQEQLISFMNIIKVLKEYSTEQVTQELLLYMNYINANKTQNITSDEIYYIKLQNTNYQSIIQYLAHLYYDTLYSRINTPLKEEIILLEDTIIDLNLQLNYSQNDIAWLKHIYQQVVRDNLYLAQGNAYLKEEYFNTVFALKDNKINKEHENIRKIISNPYNPKTIETQNISRLVHDQVIISELTEDIKQLRNELALLDPKVTYSAIFNGENILPNLKNLLNSIKWEKLSEISTLKAEKSELISNLKLQKYEKFIQIDYQIHQYENIASLREKIVEIIRSNKIEDMTNKKSIKYLRDVYLAYRKRDALINEIYIKTDEISILQSEENELQIYKNNLRGFAGNNKFLEELKMNKMGIMRPTEYIIKFWSVHEYGGMLGWVEDGGSYAPSPIIINYGYRHYKGESNSDGYYVVGSTSGSPLVYNMNTGKLHQRYKGNKDDVFDCKWQDLTHFACSDDDAKVHFYEINTQNSIDSWDPEGNDSDLKAILVLENGNIVVGDKDSELYIKYGGSNNTMATDGSDDVQGLAEIKTNLVLSAEDDQLYLINFSNPSSPNKLELFHESNRFRSILKLTNTGEFAIGGKASSKPKIKIILLNNDNSTTELKSKTVSTAEGSIYTLLEPTDGLLFIGGSFEEICTWSYKAIPSQNPLCFDRKLDSKVVGFIPSHGAKYYYWDD